MALQSLRQQRLHSATSTRPRTAVLRPVCKASTSAPTPAQPAQPVQNHLLSKVLAASLAVGITFSGHAVEAAQYNSLADIVRKDLEFVDSNKDGFITKNELLSMSQKVAEEEEFLVPSDDALDFSMKLFDLNQDGRLSTEEMLTAVTLDRAVSDQEVDSDVLSVFDKNADGYVDLGEFRAAIPDLGPNGEAVKEFVFSRVDNLVDGNRKLDTQEFANSLTMLRNSVLGY